MNSICKKCNKVIATGHHRCLMAGKRVKVHNRPVKRVVRVSHKSVDSAVQYKPCKDYTFCRRTPQFRTRLKYPFA